MSDIQGDLTTGIPMDPLKGSHCPQSGPSTQLGAGKRRRRESEEPTSRPASSTKRRHLDTSPPFPPVDTSLNTAQIAVADQLPSPEFTNSSEDHHHLSEVHSSASLSQKSPTEPCGVANPISEEQPIGSESEAQDRQIHGWVLGTEAPAEIDLQPPQIEPYPDPGPTALGAMPSAKRKSSQESLGPASSCSDDRESIASTDAKSNFYSSPAFPTLLEQHGVYIDDSPSGLDKEEMEFCHKLLSTSAPHPSGSMLDEDVFLAFSRLTHNKSEQWLVKNMHSHLFPAPELLALRGHEKFKGLGLIEGCDDIWLRAVFPSYGKCPQPDSTIAFKWGNFSKEELRKLGITIGLPSKYMARDDMFFPFITREAKCDRQSLEVADRQNVYSMSVALEGVVDLFRRADRLEDINGKALGLSMSYDNDTVRMYAHHVVTNVQELNGPSRQQLPKVSTMKYRTTIGHVTLSNHGGKDRWKPYDFFYNACLKFSQRHLKRVKEAIALLPDPAEAPAQSAPCMDEVGQALSVRDGFFKKPRNGGVSGELRRQLAGLERQLVGLERRLEEQKDESKSRELSLQDQLAAQRDDNKSLQDRLAQLQDRLAAQVDDNKSLQDRLLQLLERQSK